MLKSLLKSVRQYKTASLLTPILVAAEVVLECLLPFIMAELIDEMTGTSMTPIIKYGSVLIIMAILLLIFGVLSGKTAATASCGFARNLRQDMYFRIQEFSFADVDQFSTSSLVTRMTTDVTNIQNAYQMSIRIAVRTPLMLIFSIIMSMNINVRMAVIFVIMFPILGAVLLGISMYVYPIFKRIFKKYDAMNNSVQENIAGIRVVKSFVREDYEKRKFEHASEEVRKDFTRAEKILALNNPFVMFCIYIAMLLVSYFGANIIINTVSVDLTTGELSSLISYGIQILASMMMLSMVLVMTSMATESANRVVEVIEHESVLDKNPEGIQEVKDGSISFQNVNFKYSEKSEKNVLSDINIDIKAGETVGIIGGTGSGKTTLIQLISRLYDVTEGAVLVGGKDVRSYDLTALRNEVAVVLQKNVLFSGTIKENLRWGNAEASDEELVRVCKLAQADSFIQRFPDKYDTYIEQGGTNVSGGQKQRLCIARALLKKPKILILDDSTSAVDTKTDALIRNAMYKEIPETTKIIIAQRVSSVQDADKILVMEGGRIAEQGTHEELLRLNGIYREVYDSQTRNRGMNDMREIEKHAGRGNTFFRLTAYLMKHYKLEFIVVMVCIVISSCASVVATVFLQRLIDECITPGITLGMGAVWSQLVSILTTMAVVYILGVIAAFAYTRIMAIVTQGTLKHMRNDMFSNMQTLPIQYFDTNSHGDIMSTYTNDTDAIRQLIGQSMPMLLQSFLTVLAMFVMMLCYSIWLTLAVCVFLVFMLFMTQKVGGASSRFMMAQQESLAKEEGFVEEMLNGQKVIQVFCHEEESKSDFVKINDQLFSDSEKAFQFGNILMPILNNVGNLMYVSLAIIGGLLLHFQVDNLSLAGIGTISVGIIISFLGMARQLSQTIGQASMQVSLIAMGLAGAKRVFQLMDEKSETDQGYVTLVKGKKDEKGKITETDEMTGTWFWKQPDKESGQVIYRELTGDIRLEHVDFGYEPRKLVLRNISLFAKPGQKIAFVGATGAGKTTITNLINRFYDIADGKIYYDGIDISKIRKPDLRKSLGIVLQDVNLFTGTVMDNIRYGKLDATDEECIAAAKLANADDFIRRLSQGYQTVLTGNGSSLSQGQRQLISIARAAVADPPVMILDEATSSIDTRTEALVQDGMDNLMKGRTVFVIAHRLSTIRNSQAIMVLDHGRIIERGSHEELIAQKGTYYQLYTGAFELE